MYPIENHFKRHLRVDLLEKELQSSLFEAVDHELRRLIICQAVLTSTFMIVSKYRVNGLARASHNFSFLKCSLIVLGFFDRSSYVEEFVMV